jgi:hypothetical protein
MKALIYTGSIHAGDPDQILKGQFKENKFWYKKTIWASPEGIKCDLKLIYNFGEKSKLGKKIEVIVYTFDGNEYHQQSFKEVSDAFSSTEYHTYDKLGEYAVDSVLKKPFSWETISHLLVIAILLMTAMVNFFVATNSWNMVKEGNKPMNLTAQNTATAITNQRNDTLLMYNLCNRTLAYLRSHSP